MEPSIFFDEVNERQGVFHRRTFLMGGLGGAALLAMTGRLMELQLVEANRYQLLSASNQFNFRLRPPPRVCVPGEFQEPLCDASMLAWPGWAR